MDTPNENSQLDINPEAIKALRDHQEQILNAVESDQQVLQEIERLGGLGNFGLSLDGISDFAEGNTEEIDDRNAGFDVAFLNVLPIKHLIVNHCDGKVTIMQLDQIRDALMEAYL